MRKLMQNAIEILEKEKVVYGDVRIGHYHWQNLYTRNSLVTNISDDRSSGIGVRAMVKGGWGFASTSDLSKDAITKITLTAIEIAHASATTASNGFRFAHAEPVQLEWTTPHKIDPFMVPIPEKIDFLLEINNSLLKNKNIKHASSSFKFSNERKIFINTEGTYTDQTLLRVSGDYIATAVGSQGFETRMYSIKPLNIGYEHIDHKEMLEQTRSVAEEAVAKLKATDCPSEEADLILMPSHTALTIHETIGHATELDRVMGWEADMAGTSFATIDKLNHLKYGSEIFNVVADRTRVHGRSSVPVDDEGVRTGQWKIIKNGVLTGYSTTRSTAHFIGEEQSRGCSYADHWRSVPILRMPNVSIEPGLAGSPSLEELIADTNYGVLVDGRGSFSIDHQRINFQFGGDCAWRIRNGKKCEVLRRFTYQSHNPVFWNSVDAICNEDHWEAHGIENCGKGQPMQRAQLTHGSAPLRLKNISIGRAKI